MPTIGQRLRSIIGDQFGADLVEQRLEKAIRDAKESAAAPTTTFYDPMSLFMGREWVTKQRGSALTFDDLRSMARNPIVGAIIQTRVNQVASFCEPQKDAYDVGFRIVSDDDQAQKETPRIKEITNWVHTAGIQGHGEKNLESFVRKFIRDSLVLDQACGEVVFRRNKEPAYFVAIDGATIRRLPKSLDFTSSGSEPLYAQVVNDIIVTRYTEDQMIYGIRNPQTDINYLGYGMSELELLVRVVTTIINTEKYNSGQLAQGGTQKGILIVKGEADTTQMASFKRDFREAVRNAASYWRPPVLQVGKESEVKWETLDRANRDMEYAQLFEFLVKQACGVYQMEPSEINWSTAPNGASTVFESGNGVKISEAQKRGLRPVLNFLANELTSNLVSKIDPRYRLEFVGMNLDRNADAELRVKEVTNYKTVNEVRRDMMMDDLPGGDIVLNQFWMKAQEAKAATEGGAPPEGKDKPADPKKAQPDDYSGDMEFDSVEDL